MLNLSKKVFPLFLIFSAQAFSSVAPAPYQLSVEAGTECPGSKVAIATFKFSDPAYGKLYRLSVFHADDSFKTVGEASGGGEADYRDLHEALKEIRSGGLVPVAVFNAGFFDEKVTKTYSYFKSSFFMNELAYNSWRGPRACMVYDSQASSFQVLQSTTSNYEWFKSALNTEIYCAGPQMIENGENVALRQHCSEQFDWKCRDDKKDPGLNFLISYPRTSSCVTESGDLKVFAVMSEQEKCGMLGEHLARLMIAQGCVQGMNHDGGGSAKLYLDDGQNPPFVMNGVVGDQDRAMPTWVTILRK